MSMANVDTDGYQKTVSNPPVTATTPSAKPEPSPLRKTANGRHLRVGLTAGLAGAAMIVAAIILFLKLGRYDVQITLDDPEIRLSIDGETVVLDEIQSPIRLSAGPHALVVERDGLTAETDEITVKRKGKNVIHVAVIDGRLAVLRDGEKIAAPGAPAITADIAKKHHN